MDISSTELIAIQDRNTRTMLDTRIAVRGFRSETAAGLGRFMYLEAKNTTFLFVGMFFMFVKLS